MSGYLFALMIALVAAAITAIVTAAVALARAERLDRRRGVVLAALALVAISAGAVGGSAVTPPPTHVEAIEPAPVQPGSPAQPLSDPEPFTAQLPTLALDDVDEASDPRPEAPAADPHPDPEAAEEDLPASEAIR